MSLRNRIVVAGLLLTLVAPAAGWGLKAQIDPDGQSLVSTDFSDPEQAVPGTTTERTLSTATTDKARAATSDGSSGSLLDRFLLWLHTMVHPF